MPFLTLKVNFYFNFERQRYYFRQMKKHLLFAFLISLTCSAFSGIPGYLGISIKAYKSGNTKGIQIINVFDESPAKQYGLKENDIITSVDSKVMLEKTDLTSFIDNHNWGDKVNVNFIRNGKTFNKDVVLGYKSNVRTYNVKKVVKTDGEHWLFTDDHTEVFVLADNTPVSISKTDDAGNTESWQPGTLTQTEVPQYFLDFDDKMYCIKRIKEDQAKRNCKINDIIFIKEIKESIKDSLEIRTELLPELFSVYPNPNNGQFTLEFSSNDKGTLQVYIFDITGRVVKSDILQNFDGKYNVPYDLTNEPKGAYLLQLKIGDKMTSKKIIIQ